MSQPSLAVAVVAALPPTIAALLSFAQARLSHRSSAGTAVAVEQLQRAVEEMRAGLQRVDARVAELDVRMSELEGRPRRGGRRRAARRP